MATTSTPNAATTPPAGDKSGGAIKVATPDQDGNFHLNVAKSAVSKVQIVDVDMILTLKDGTKVVLAGGAIGAMDESTSVQYSDGKDKAGHMMEQVGKIALQKDDHPLVLNSTASADDPNQAAAAHAETNKNLAAQAQAANATLAAISQALAQIAAVIQSNAPSVQSTKTGDFATAVVTKPTTRPVPEALPERAPVTPETTVIGPKAPSMAVSLFNLTSITQVGSTLYGSGGTLKSATDSTNDTQFAAQVINGTATATTIYADGTMPTGQFVKVLDVQLGGDGKMQTLTVSGVPDDVHILNAINLGGGLYSVTVSANIKDYQLQLAYNTLLANPNGPVHEQFTLNISANIVTATGVQTVGATMLVAIKDVSAATDLVYVDPATGLNVYVLPAQGVAHIIHAGDSGVTIYGSNAKDVYYGGAGNDTIIGGNGNDYFEGGAGADTLLGGSGNNTAGYTLSASGVTIDLSTGFGTGGDAQGDKLTNINSIIGSSYDDTFIIGPATATVSGGAGGSDTLSFALSTAAVTVDLNAGTSSGGYASHVTYSHIQNVIGTAFSDTFVASSDANHFDGGSGGSDTVSYAASTAGVTVNLATGVGSGGYAAGDSYTHIQNVIGSAYNDTFGGNSDINYFNGGSGGQDTVSYANSAAGVTVNFVTGRGTGGDAEGDTYLNVQNVIGSAYDDTFIAAVDSRSFNGGSGGADTVSYVTSNAGITIDTINNVGSGGYANNNTYTNIRNFIGTGYSDTFIAGSSPHNFDGGTGGSDTVSFATAPGAVTVDLYTGTSSGSYAQGDTLTHIQNVIGGAGDDLFYASAEANSFNGGAGSNTVSYLHSTLGVVVDLTNTIGTGTADGYAAGDSFVNIQNLIGSVYDDAFVSGAAANTLDGGTGSLHNRVSYAASTAAVTVDLNYQNGTGTFGGYASGDILINIQDLTGGAGNDTFVASAAANYFDGGLGLNTVSYSASTAGVTVDLVSGLGSGGYAAGDTYANIQNVTGSSGNDLFYATGVANVFIGNGGVDTVSYFKATDGTGVTVNLDSGVGTGGFAAGDSYTGIQNVIGTSHDDLFIASSLANAFDGGLGNNTVSYVTDTTGVTVNLVTGIGTAGYAAGDTYAAIQNVIGGSGNDTFVANNIAGIFDGGVSTATSHNRIDYSNSIAAVTVDLIQQNGGGTSGGYATGDVLKNIQDVTGSSFDDIFIASAAANYFDGGVSTAASHNLVSYTNDTAGVSVDLSTPGALGVGGLAAGDTFTNIQDVTGGSGNDSFIASAAANNFDGGSGAHNRVSYLNDTAGVTIDLYTVGALGVGGFAAGDKYTNIQDVTGGSGNDTFIANAVANYFDGGVSTASSHNQVSYVNDSAGVTVDLFTVGALGVAGLAAGDTYTNIQDVTGGSGNDSFFASAAANYFDGGASTASSHNLVSYVNDTAGVTVNLFTAGALGVGGLAAGDKYTNIQDVTGGSGNDTFIASAAANYFDGGVSTAASHNQVSYANDTVGVTVNLFVAGTLGVGGLAAGDTYTNIQDVTGGSGNDTFIASAAANYFDGGTSTAASHNLVSYVNDTAGVTVDLSSTVTLGVGGLAAGDTYANIQDVTGGSGDDKFIASAAANYFDGGTSTAASHNLVSYINDTAGVTVDLSSTAILGVGGLAAGDKYTNIQDVTGGSGNDTFIASAAANYFDGGTSTAASHNLVSYINDTAGVTVNLFTAGTLGVGGLAVGDTYTNIQDVTGGSGNDTFIASASANYFDGGAGTHNLVSYANDTVGVTVDLSSTVTLGVGGLAAGDKYTNIQDVTGGSGNDTFIASAVANYFDGGTGLHNRVSYTNDTAGVTVDLSSTAILGVGGLAAGDKYTNIQDVTGGSGNDTFIASSLANYFDGGGGLHNRVSYANDTAGVTVDLSSTVTLGVGGLAA
ncbi:calcium-binding protein, partial [Herbaspirillum sp. RTI4]|uniref:beta strand repeat-containing protein n=1 Tax=Herbaspirillum sp. RTI4 TaxID=3048640 RepID=UPI002B236141